MHEHFLQPIWVAARRTTQFSRSGRLLELCLTKSRNGGRCRLLRLVRRSPVQPSMHTSSMQMITCVSSVFEDYYAENRTDTSYIRWKS